MAEMRRIKDELKCPSCGERFEREVGVYTDQTLRDEIARLSSALTRIVNWEMPESGRTWDDGTPMSYGAAFGSNGQRDVIRQIAADALSAKTT